MEYISLRARRKHLARGREQLGIDSSIGQTSRSSSSSGSVPFVPCRSSRLPIGGEGATWASPWWAAMLPKCLVHRGHSNHYRVGSKAKHSWRQKLLPVFLQEVLRAAEIGGGVMLLLGFVMINGSSCGSNAISWTTEKKRSFRGWQYRLVWL